jgi:23S rRNA (uracil1939-C5)-methyltransferase
MPQAAGVSVFRDRNASQRKNRDEEQKSLVSVGDPYLIYKTLAGQYRVSAGSFFQANRHLADELIKIVTDGESGKHALDLYAGVGFFSTALARDFHHVVSVEASQTSFADLSYNRSSNGEVIQATTEQYLARSEDARRIGKGEVLPHISYKPDLAVVDPPRGGLGERVARGLATLGAPRVTYVSCDPATLARDLVIVLGAGYRVERVHLIDMFPQTYHIESVVQLAK